MILNNYKEILSCGMKNSDFWLKSTTLKSTSNNEGLNDSNTKLIEVFGQNCSKYKEVGNDYNTNTSGADNNGCGLFIIVGNGATPPTTNDYKLNSFVELYPVSASVAYYQNGTTLTVTRTFKNTGAEDITVSEVGLCGSAASNTSINSNFLLAREVLSSPVTIKPNEMYTFTIAIE